MAIKSKMTKLLEFTSNAQKKILSPDFSPFFPLLFIPPIWILDINGSKHKTIFQFLFNAALFAVKLEITAGRCDISDIQAGGGDI